MNGSFTATLRKQMAATIALELLLIGLLITAFGYVIQIRGIVQSESTTAHEVPRVLAASNVQSRDPRLVAETILTHFYHPDLGVIVGVGHLFYKGEWTAGTTRYTLSRASELDVPFSLRSAGFLGRTSSILAAMAGYKGTSVRFGDANIVIESGQGALIRAVERFGAMLAAVAVLALVLANIAAWRLTKRALEPLHLVLRELEAFARGDLRPRRIVTTRDDELGRLAVAYNGAVATVNRALAERARAETQMRQFMTDAAHQLRTPLTVLRGFISILRKGDIKSPDDVPRILDTMDRQSATMATLIKKLMLLQDWEDDACQRQPVDIGRLVEEIVAPLAGANPDRQLLLHIKNNGQVKIAPDEFSYAVTNLIDNAIKYAPEGEIIVTVDRDETNVSVSVSDRGPGISDEEIERIFDRFYRGARRNVSGSGLGLAIARRAVERARGTINVVSTPSGTCFTIMLPAIDIMRAPMKSAS